MSIVLSEEQASIKPAKQPDYECGCIAGILAAPTCPAHGAPLSIDPSKIRQTRSSIYNENEKDTDIVPILSYDRAPRPKGLIELPVSTQITVDIATTILNTREYRGCDKWRLDLRAFGDDKVIGEELIGGTAGYSRTIIFTTFEAIAIAKELLLSQP